MQMFYERELFSTPLKYFKNFIQNGGKFNSFTILYDRTLSRYQDLNKKNKKIEKITAQSELCM